MTRSRNCNCALYSGFAPSSRPAPIRRRCAVERDERARADALDRQWNALLRGEATSTTDLDADLATLVARLHAAGSAIPPLFPDRHQAWRELSQAATPAPVSWSDGKTTPLAWPGRTQMAMPIPSRGGRKPLHRG